MNRREALRLLATGVTLPLTTPGLLASLRDARAIVQAQPASRTLESHQRATVTAIAEMMIPKTDTPGATEAGVPEFINLMVGDWYTDQQRSHFLQGLEDVDARARLRFRRRFIECSSAQRAEILTDLGTEMTGDLKSFKNEIDNEKTAPGNFYYMLRTLILTGYYTSEAGATAELNYEIIPDRYDPCAVGKGEKGAAGIGEH